jgi:RNA polymerase sigma-70 factor (ECF subfamily)
VPLEAALQDPGVQSRLALEELDPDALPDRLLDLLFVCAHPAIDPAVRTPLMLQTVLGYDAAQVAAAFSVPASTMAQRLVRAKRRIKGARIPFVVPGREQLPERLPPVLEAVYGCWSIDRSAEAAHLAVTLTALLPDEPEVWGLAALVTLSRARGASTDRYQPLDEQDPAAWDAALLADGERFLQRAAPGPLGRFQCEAAVQAVHCARAHTGSTDWAALRTLYEALRVLAPTLGGAVALAAVVGRLDGPAAGLAELDRIAADAAVPPFQPWWAARGHLLVTAGRLEEAVPALERALALTTDPAQAEHLRRRLTDLPHTRRTATRG